jgi:hypothetical protein
VTRAPCGLRHAPSSPPRAARIPSAWTAPGRGAAIYWLAAGPTSPGGYVQVPRLRPDPLRRRPFQESSNWT